ncbi:AbfB domain-containing protein [Synechocystis sp. LKSZ1]|uniref:AbfB domain-containing protein n=1 Tax=Synechocystis sp. LKSZ1 TaxID=3144951 RepID=UPI00336BC289
MKILHFFPLFSLTLALAISPIASFFESKEVQAQGSYVRYQSVNYPERYIRHRNYLGYIEPIKTDLDKLDSSFRIITGLANPNCISLESKNFPNHFLRHRNYRVILSANDNSNLFKQDATFCPKNGLSSKGGISFESNNYPGHYIRHRNFELWLDKFSGFTESTLFRDDATFIQRDAP